MVHSMDENVGRVLAKLDDLGLRQNTLVVFSSDNGGFTRFCKLNKGLQVANNTPLRSGKGSCYEGGIRVPLIVRGPGVSANKECSTPVISCDLFHTFLDAAQIDERPDEPTDGLSLKSLLVDPGAKLKRDTLHFHYPHYYSTTTPVSAIRQGHWKLLEYYEDRPLELYRLDRDPGESTNLAAAQPAIAGRLQKELRSWRKRVDALEPESNPAKNDARRFGSERSIFKRGGPAVRKSFHRHDPLKAPRRPALKEKRRLHPNMKNGGGRSRRSWNSSLLQERKSKQRNEAVTIEAQIPVASGGRKTGSTKEGTESTESEFWPQPFPCLRCVPWLFLIGLSVLSQSADGVRN